MNRDYLQTQTLTVCLVRAQILGLDHKHAEISINPELSIECLSDHTLKNPINRYNLLFIYQSI